MSVTVTIKVGNNWKKIPNAYAGAGGVSVNVGILEGATYSGETGTIGQPVASIAAIHEFGTENIPARSFMRSTLAAKKDDWRAAVAVYLKAHPGNVRGAVAFLGEMASRDMQAAIEEGISPPLKQETIMAKVRRKGSRGNPALPLVDTGAMQEAISYEVQE